MATYMQGALKAGAGFSENPSGSGVGFAMFTQSKTNSGISGLTQDITFELPPGSQLIAIIPDVLTAYDSATSATLSVGTTSGGTQYASAINAKTAGRAAVTVSAAQAAAMDDIGTSTSVVATITSVGQPTAGLVRVTLQYAIVQ